MSEAELRRVAALLEVGRWEAALRLLVPLMAGDPNSVRMACLMARCHYQAQDWPAMLAETERACALAPNDEFAHRLRSVALRGLKRPEEAVAAAREAVRLAPGLWHSHVVLAEALLDRPDLRSRLAARDAVRRALALAPDNHDVRTLAGRTQSTLGDLRGARTHYEQVLAASPNHAGARNGLAVLDLHRSRASAAADQIQAVLADNPANPLFVRNAQLAATMWLGRLQLTTSGLYFACWLAAAILPHGAVRDALAALVATGTVVLTALAYRRLPPGIARMVRRPAIELPGGRRSRTALRRSHVITMVLAALQVAVALTMLVTALPLWTSLQLLASAAAVPPLLRLTGGWARAASRARLRRRNGVAGGLGEGADVGGVAGGVGRRDPAG